MTDREQAVLTAVQGNQSAFEFLMAIIATAHVWDDLIDRDVAVTDEQINAAFWNALVTIPGNLFYQQNFTRLQPLVSGAIVNWQAATRMERGTEQLDYEIAFILRSSYADLITQCASIIGGPAWAVDATIQIRRFVHAEGYETYLQSLQAETAARELK